MTISAADVLEAAFLSNAAYENSDNLIIALSSKGWRALGSDPIPTGQAFAGQQLAPPSLSLLPTWDTYFGEGNGDSNFLFDNFNAQGFVARRENTLTISFRGTDAFSSIDGKLDVLDWFDFQAHYERFSHFIQSIDSYLFSHPEITKVLVTGHSLGAAMAHAYMASHADTGTRQYVGVTFASPGADANWPSDPNANRTVDFHNVDDPIDFAAYHDGIYQAEFNAMAAVVAVFLGLALDDPEVVEVTYRVFQELKAENVGPPGDDNIIYFDSIEGSPFPAFAQHSMALYEAILGFVVEEASNVDWRLYENIVVGREADDLIGTSYRLDIGQEYFNWGRDVDILHGGIGRDLLVGGGNNDVLFGLGGADALRGGSGNDILVGGSGIDIIDGGSGVDVADFSDRNDISWTINIFLVTGTATASTGGTDTLFNIEDIVTGGGNDRITGNSLANIFTGGAGNDTFFGGGGTDTAVFLGSLSGYTITRNSDGSIKVVSAIDGIDTLYSVEFGIFNGSAPYTLTNLVPTVDTTAPVLLSNGGFYPLDNAANVDVTTNIVLSFDERVKPGSGNIVIQNSNGTIFKTIPIGDAQVTFQGSQIIINPTGDFAPGASYVVSIGSGVIKNDAGLSFAGFGSNPLNFTTASAAPTDTMAPFVVSMTPLDNAVGVSTNADIVLRFSEVVVADSGNVVIHKSDGSLISIPIFDVNQVHFSGDTVTIDPSVNLDPGSDYFVTIDTGAVRDAALNPFAGMTSSSSLNFTTLSAANTSSVFLNIFDNSLPEGPTGTNRTLSFGVSLSGAGAGTQETRVNYTTGPISGGSFNATAGVDYISTSGTLIIPAGSTSGLIDITLVGDNSFEPDEVFRVTLSQPSSNVTVLRQFATGFIDNDDAQPNQFPITVNDVEIGAPGSTVLINVLANDSDPDGDTLHINQVFSVGLGGTTPIEGNGTFSISGNSVAVTPNAGISGIFSVGYVADDGKGGLRNGYASVIVGGDGTPGKTDSGSVLNDTLTGTGGNDTLSGGLGDDIILGSEGPDRIDGGAGFDFLDLQQAGHGASMQLRDPWMWDDGDGGNDILINVEGVYGTAFDDLIDGANHSIEYITTGYRFYGNDGNDRLVADAGNDVLDGGAGNDEIKYGAGQDIASGGAGNDLIYAFSGSSDTIGDILDGGSGDDFLYATNSPASPDILLGGDGNDYLQFSNGDTVTGGRGADIFRFGGFAANNPFQATITDLRPGDQIQWNFPTPVVINNTAVYFVGAIANGSGATTGLDHVEYSTGGGITKLYFGYDATPGADFILSISGIIPLNNLQADSSNSSALKILVLGAVPSAPTSITISNASVSENSATGALVGLLSAADPDANEVFTYSLLNDAGGRFALNGMNLITAGALDYETAQFHDVTVRVTDSYGLSSDKALSIKVIDENEGGPSITSNGGGASDTFSTAENLTGAIAMIGAIDVDSATKLAYSISGGVDQGRFQINASTGALTFRQTPDFETPADADSDNVYEVDVQASDGMYSDTQTLAIEVTNVGGSTIDGTSGDDVINSTKSALGQSLPGNEEDSISGDGGNDLIDALGGDDLVIGGFGNDRLAGGLNGLAGDTVSYAGVLTDVMVNLSLTAQQDTKGAGKDTIIGFENLTGGNGNDLLTGDVKANVINGGAGNDTLIGGAGDDTLNGGDHDDLLIGGLGADQLHGGAGINTVSYLGSVGAVTVVLGDGGELSSNNGSVGGGDALGDTGEGFANIIGSAVKDTLTGNALDNLIEGGALADELHGGGGLDTVSYAGSSALVSVMLGANGELNANGGLVQGGHAAGDTGDGFENIRGSAFNDVLTGNDTANVITGGAGNDMIEGLGGSDTLDGGLGVNTLSYAKDATGLTIDLSTKSASGAGSDAAGDTIINFQNVTGGGAIDELTGDDFANILLGNGGNDILSGGKGNDTLTGGDGNDLINGGLGDDKLTADGGTVAGAGTSDTVSYAGILADVTANLSLTTLQDTKGAGKDTLVGFENLTGGDGNDTLTGDLKANIIQGGAGDDVLKGGLGNDTLNGGANGLLGDTASWLGITVAVTADLGVGTATYANAVNVAGGKIDTDTLTDIENLIGGNGADKLTGDGGDNVIEGGAGIDTLDGGGDDTIGDTVSYAGATVTVNVNLLTNVVSGGAGNDILEAGSFENITGGKSADVLSGDNDVNRIMGGEGNDTLSGLGGADILEGGKGNDILIGGLGADELNGGDGNADIASYASDTTGVTVSLASKTGGGAGSEAEGDALEGVENVLGGSAIDELTGDDFSNILLGNAGNDILSGGKGNDTLTGGDGNDVIDGGLGDDKLTADGGTVAGAGTSDTVSYASILTDVTVNLALTMLQDTKGAGKDTLLGFENLTGGEGNDLLTGDTKANIINGGVGNDTLVGGGGNDTLTGGVGNDLFKFLNAAGGSDTILDFDSAFDLISIVKTGFAIGAVTTAAFSMQDYVVSDAGHAATAAHAQFLFDETTSELWFDSNGALAGGTQSLIATLTGVSSLSAADFELK